MYRVTIQPMGPPVPASLPSISPEDYRRVNGVACAIFSLACGAFTVTCICGAAGLLKTNKGGEAPLEARIALGFVAGMIIGIALIILKCSGICDGCCKTLHRNVSRNCALLTNRPPVQQIEDV